MGRPKELSKEEREELIAKGYKPVEVWVPDIESDEVWDAILRECKEIRDAQEDAEASLFVEEGLKETLGIIEAKEKGS